MSSGSSSLSVALPAAATSASGPGESTLFDVTDSSMDGPVKARGHSEVLLKRDPSLPGRAGSDSRVLPPTPRQAQGFRI